MKKYDVIALGELLIDFTENGRSDQGNKLYESNPGGAPCNVLAMLARLGHAVGFIGKVGDDIFGRQLSSAIEEVGIDSSNLCVDKSVHTTLAFVEKLENGDRDFSFYRNPGADMMLSTDEINADLLKDTRVFHFGTLSMTHQGVREATKYAIHEAKKNGALISFDPNLREPLWESLEDAKEQTLYGLGHCDILKISDNEIIWLTGETDFDKAVAKIREHYNIPLIFLTMGPDGSRAYYQDKDGKQIVVKAKAFITDETIETTGAGDTFMGCALHWILELGLYSLTATELSKILSFANAAASIVTTRRGALSAMPVMEEILQQMS